MMTTDADTQCLHCINGDTTCHKYQSLYFYKSPKYIL